MPRRFLSCASFGMTMGLFGRGNNQQHVISTTVCFFFVISREERLRNPLLFSTELTFVLEAGWYPGDSRNDDGVAWEGHFVKPKRFPLRHHVLAVPQTLNFQTLNLQFLNHQQQASSNQQPVKPLNFSTSKQKRQRSNNENVIANQMNIN